MAVLVDGYIRLDNGGAHRIAALVERHLLVEWAEQRGWHVRRLVEETRRPPAGPPPQLRAALARVGSRESDGIVVVTLAHLGDSLVQALDAIEQITAAGGAFASVRERIDLSTPSGQQSLRLLISVTAWWTAT